MANVANSTELRTRIQSANGSDPTINLTAATTYSVTTLAKTPSNKTQPAVAFSGYTIQSSVPLTPPAQGASSSIELTRDFSNTRIYQQNIDGPYSPGLIKDVELTYSSGTDALLSATAGNFTLTNVKITGTHSGWAGNGNKYFSLTSFNPAAPITVPLTLTNVSVDITGQQGFNGVTGTGGSAFLHSWNNKGPVSITNSIFDEAGFKSSFHLFNFDPIASSSTNVISGNSFGRSSNANVRSEEGNFLGNVKATLTNNTFKEGSYVDLYADVSGITFASNTFATIAGGYGIRATKSPTNIDVLTGSPTFTGTNTFTGPGLALKYVSTAGGTNDFINYSGTFSVGGNTFSRLIASGQGNDNLSSGTFTTPLIGLNAWISADAGDDSITSSTGNDSLNGGDGNDTLTGGLGNDTISGGNDNDSLLGGNGDDALGGDDGNDTLVAGGGNDTLAGGNGTDSMSGNAGNDILDGGADNDTLVGGGGFDTLTGGTGADIFSWTSGDQEDIITDFSIGQTDQMRLGSVNFPGTTSASPSLSDTAYQEVDSLVALGSTNLNLKVTELTFGYTTAQADSLTSSTVQNGYLLFFDTTSNTSWLYYDGDWSTTGTAGDRKAFHLPNITTLGDLTAFSNAQFREV